MARRALPDRGGGCRHISLSPIKVLIVTTSLWAAGAASHASETPQAAAAEAGPAEAAPELRLPRDEEGVPYYLYVPAERDPAAPPLVTVHGISRGADEHLAAFTPWAERSGRVLIAPLFSEEQCRRYQKVILDRCQADRALFATLREVAEETGVQVERFDLFGFSGGAQFAHRFALLHPERVGRLAVASAGWYSMPDFEEAFPYGLAQGRSSGRRFQAKLEAFLGIPILVLVGAQDTARDSGLRKTRRVDRRQGRNRVERAVVWAEALRAAAIRAEVPAQIALQVMPGCGHSFEDCVREGELTREVMAWFAGP